MKSPEATSIILESISDGVFTVDAEWRITSFNRAAEEITGVPRAEALGRRCAEVFRSSMCEATCALRRTLATGKPIINRSAFIIDAEGRRIPISVSTALLRDGRGRTIGGAETFRDLSLIEELREEAAGQYRLGELVSQSAAMQRLFAIVPQLAASDCTVLIHGETGTGKELFARALHEHSPRRGRPFVAVNCGALPEPLLESELFGYEAGAFTGATQRKPGRFALAQGGTLLLDEIGELSPAFQVRLLRVLQEKTYEPVGGTKTVQADVRILAATHRDLAAMVRAGTFREDLFYRINVVRLDLPPLRQRKEDIPTLVEHLIARLNRRHGKALAGITGEALGLLMAHDFPGNVRELENVLEHAFVLCDKGRLGVAHLPAGLRGDAAPGASGSALAGTVREVEAQAIRAALERHHGNRLAAARDLGLHKSTLFRKLKALGIAPPARDGRHRA
jgi:PAS domain S-box-containing protein